MCTYKHMCTGVCTNNAYEYGTTIPLHYLYMYRYRIPVR